MVLNIKNFSSVFRCKTKLPLYGWSHTLAQMENVVQLHFSIYIISGKGTQFCGNDQ